MEKVLQFLYTVVALIGFIPVMAFLLLVKVIPGLKLEPGAQTIAAMVVAPVIGIVVLIAVVLAFI